MTTWADRALEAALEGSRNDPFVAKVAVTAAWTDGPEAFCLLYSMPDGPPGPVVGIRRQRGDSDTDLTEYLADLSPRVRAGLTAIPKAERDEHRRSPDDPIEFGHRLVESISHGVGVFGNHLRYDDDGIGWWGSLGAALPGQPS